MNLGVLSASSCPAGTQHDNLRNLVFVGLRGPKNSIIQPQSEIKQRGLENVSHFLVREMTRTMNQFWMSVFETVDNAAIWDSLIQPCIKCLTPVNSLTEKTNRRHFCRSVKVDTRAVKRAWECCFRGDGVFADANPNTNKPNITFWGVNNSPPSPCSP